MDPNFAQGLHSALQQTTVPDSNAIKAATEQLQNVYFKNPACVPALAEILSSSPDFGVRQLASVELRKLINKKSKFWTKQAQDVRAGIKAKLLQLVSEERNALVRNGIARVVSAIARIELPLNTWPELLPFLFSAAESPDANHRQASIFVFYTVLETFVDDDTNKLTQYLPQIMVTFSKALQDPESLEVRITTVRGLGKVAESVDDESPNDLAALQGAVPSMVQVLNQCFEQTHTEGAKHIFGVFELLFQMESQVVNPHLTDLVDFLLTKAADKDNEEDLRLMSLNAVTNVVTYRRSRVQNLGLAKTIIQRVMPIVVEEDNEDPDDETPSRLALRIIDSLSTELPPPQVFPHLLEQLQAYAAHADPHHRKAALMAFSVAIEGCSEYLRPHLDKFWPLVESGLRDPEPVVQKAACLTIGCLCEDLGNETSTKYATFLPALMDLINKPETQKQGCVAIDSLLECMDAESISQYLPSIMERLSVLLETADIKVKATVTGAIGSAAHASKEAFLPYFPRVVELMTPHLLLTEQGDELDLRGITTDTMGTFAEAVGKEAFRPYHEDLMKHCFEALNIDSPQLRECSFIFFAGMARVYQDEFVRFLPHVVPKVIESLQQPEHEGLPGANPDGTVSGIGVPGSSTEGATANGAVDDDEDEDYIDDDDWNGLNVNTAVSIEKEVAADSLATLFGATKAGFLPYVEASVAELLGLLDHFYYGIRKSVVETLFSFIGTLHEVSGASAWKPGAEVTPLNTDVQRLVDAVFPAVLAAWELEDDRTVASSLCLAITECLSKCGPALLAPKYLSQTCDIVAQVLEKRSPPTLEEFDPETTNENEASEYESALVSAAVDLLGGLAGALGADFAPLFTNFLPQLSKYYTPGRSDTERSTAIGGFAEIILGLRGSVTPFTGQILPILSRAIADEAAQVRQNAAFASGLLIEYSEQDLTPHFPALLTALQPNLVKSENDSEELQIARDNACGCLGRMIIRRPEHVPIDQALPILFSALPLQQDYAEWAPVLTALISLVQSNNAVAVSHLDTILQLFAHVLGSKEEDMITPELRGQCVGFISALASQVPDKVEAAGLKPYLV
ncbi:hypothetical protein OC846_001068 [Tilletia horrida]|uniref:Importin N-terminal domain-containing protein n=1 Tax=Tilletia horrida TaxID=155126 RepID=A0AAN6GTF1_9BASI|nr:hypothetical protein OC846_001068 [Tilletia horrida]KAK0569860.1 hypothetical protein OC861_000441 [Tilletia horrida]